MDHDSSADPDDDIKKKGVAEADPDDDITFLLLLLLVVLVQLPSVRKTSDTELILRMRMMIATRMMIYVIVMRSNRFKLQICLSVYLSV